MGSTSVFVVLTVVMVTMALAVLIHRVNKRRVDAILLILSGGASLMLALVATSGISAITGSTDHMMTLEMSESRFHFGLLPPVFIVATLTVMRGLFKFFQE